MNGYVKTFKYKGKDKDREKVNKFFFFGLDDDKLSEKHKTIWTKIEDLQNIELHSLTDYNKIYIKTKIRTYRNKVYTNFRGLNSPEDGI